jgi:hypothetical protein
MVLLTGAESSAGLPVTLELVGGERLTAEVDDRTSSQQLWLRYAYGQAQVLRAIEWDRIARATVKREDLDAAAFRAMALQLRSPYEPPSRLRPSPGAEAPAQPDRFPQSLLSKASVWPCRVESIWASAELAHWDADPECDGLLLQVVPLDCFGAPVPVAGTLEVELQEGRVRQPRSLGRWTAAIPCPVVGKPSGSPVFVHQLPFGPGETQSDSSFSKWGLVRVTLSVPGQGVFQRSISEVLLRQETPVPNWAP